MYPSLDIVKFIMALLILMHGCIHHVAKRIVQCRALHCHRSIAGGRWIKQNFDKGLFAVDGPFLWCIHHRGVLYHPLSFQHCNRYGFYDVSGYLLHDAFAHFVEVGKAASYMDPLQKPEHVDLSQPAPVSFRYPRSVARSRERMYQGVAGTVYISVLRGGGAVLFNNG